MTPPALGLGLALLAVLPLGTAFAGTAQSTAQTLKERLSDKASDEQRVDNCKVPLGRRGPKARPDCPAIRPSAHPS
ncbi:MAG TPA: hypothetical protein VLI93_10400 [Acetobacteraceae bacterium]|nr:hypothetical protein [Acetobacteraceae bacterium]